MMSKGQQTQQQVLDILGHADGPMTAYEILGLMNSDNQKIAPPTIYRALAALTDKGRAHRIESANAYVACQHDHHDETAMLAICDDCGAVEEIVDKKMVDQLNSIAGSSGFKTKHQVVEMRGSCNQCSDEGAKP